MTPPGIIACLVTPSIRPTTIVGLAEQFQAPDLEPKVAPAFLRGDCQHYPADFFHDADHCLKLMAWSRLQALTLPLLL
jgi:hypothetical protein